MGAINWAPNPCTVDFIGENRWTANLLYFNGTLNTSCIKCSDLTHLSLASFLSDIGKQYRPRSDAAERGIWSGSPLFAYRMLY